MFTQPPCPTRKKWHSCLVCFFQPAIISYISIPCLLKYMNMRWKKKKDCIKLLLLISQETNLKWNALRSRTAGRSLILTAARHSRSKSMIMHANVLAGEFSLGLCTHAVRTDFTKHPWHTAFIYFPICLISWYDRTARVFNDNLVSSYITNQLTTERGHLSEIGACYKGSSTQGLVDLKAFSGTIRYQTVLVKTFRGSLRTV